MQHTENGTSASYLTGQMNWAGNIRYNTATVFRPSSVSELQDIVRHNASLRALGSRHSFNRIADSSNALVSTENFREVIHLDKEKRQVTIGSGCRYGDIATFLHEAGFALPNLASLPHITVAGAVATATHGSGVANQSLASAVSGVELVTGNGDLICLSRSGNPDIFDGIVVSLGMAGIVTSLTLDLQPAFDINQFVFLDLPIASLKRDFYNMISSAYSISLFTDWASDRIAEVWVKQKAHDTHPSAFGDARLAVEDVHPIHGESAENVTTQRGITGPWFERLPHFKMGFKPSAGAELQSEFFIPLENAVEGIAAMQELSAAIRPCLLISEIRTIAADDLWMSPFFRRPAVAFHFTWKQESEKVMRILPAIESALKPFNVRPHWGKLFTLSPDYVQCQYEKLDDFRKLVNHFDPKRKFSNEFTEQYIFNVHV